MDTELQIQFIKIPIAFFLSAFREVLGVLRGFFLFVIFLSFFIIPSKSSAEIIDPIDPEMPLAIDEVSVLLYVKDLGTYEISAAIQGQDIYLPVVDVFNFLKIRAIPGNGFDMVSGFFINSQNTYQIDRANNLIIYQGKTYSLRPSDFIVSETNLYLKSKYFDQIFGLKCNFNFRTLTVSLKSEIELPAIREMRLEQMHANLDRLRGVMKADTTITRKYPLFHFGMADWSINATQTENGLSNTRLQLGLGAILAGGELNTSLLYNTHQPFTEKQQYYLWRYANNDNQALKQLMLGKIAANSISSIFNPVVGIQFTNAPTVNKKSFGTYTLSNYTQPNWTVELYVNNTLIDYVKADASGFFTFNVPLIYGSTNVTLRYFGPWGEEQTSKQSFSIPFTFLPPKELQYKVSSGIIEDNKNSLFGQARLNYGLTKTITVGGGLEYNSSIITGKNIVFLNTSIRLPANALFNGEYIYGVRYKGLLNYRLPSNFQMELYYSKYNPGQQAISVNYSEERRVMISKPFHIQAISALSRFTLSQNFIQLPGVELPPTKYTIPEFLLSGATHGVSLSLTTLAYIINNLNTSFYSDVALSTTLPAGILFTPQIRFDYLLNKTSIVKCVLEKHFIKYGTIVATYQHNIITQYTFYQIGFRYNFSFARVGFNATQSNGINSLTEYASGSLVYQPEINYLDKNVNTNVGRGGLMFLPFLDINNNGIKDKNEPKVSGLNVMMSGGGSQKISKEDTTIVILGLEPFTNYFVELDGNNFENIAWRIKKPKMYIAIESNKLKLIEIPISIVGEASGTVYIKRKYENTGLGRISVCFYNNDSVLVNKTLTESDGYFSFLGLLPGSYYAKIDSAQLNQLQMTSSPADLPFTIKSGIDGDVVDGLKFIVQSKVRRTTKSVLEKQLISNPDSLSILAEKKDIIKQQQQLKVTNPSEVSDTLRMMLALTNKRHQEDSIKLANKQMEAVENLKTFEGQVNADKGKGNVSNVDKDKNLAQMDSIKRVNKKMEAVKNIKTLVGPVKADEGNGNRSNTDKDKNWAQMDSLINVLTGKIKPGAKISANDLARIEASKITKSDLAKFVDKTVYTIQIGAYTTGLPKNILAEVLKLDLEVESYKDEKDGLTKYFIGYYNTYEAASNARTAIEQRGLKGPFVIVINNGEIISIKELINKNGK